MRKLTPALIAAALLATAGALTSRAAGNPTTYTAKVFMRGMTVPVPDSLTIHKDKFGSLEFQAATGPNHGGWAVTFFLDPRVLAPHGRALPDVGHTAVDILAWLRTNPNFVVSAPAARRIGGVPAKSVDLDVTLSAPKEDPHCPSACITWLSLLRRGPATTTASSTAPGTANRSGCTSQHSAAAALRTYSSSWWTRRHARCSSRPPGCGQDDHGLTLPAKLTSG